MAEANDVEYRAHLDTYTGFNKLVMFTLLWVVLLLSSMALGLVAHVGFPGGPGRRRHDRPAGRLRPSGRLHRLELRREGRATRQSSRLKSSGPRASSSLKLMSELEARGPKSMNPL